jgi:hypothetical protein
MCVRDTPGVNDTFLVREQITVNAIRSSRVCVVVLSAHQALSTVDMALIRMIANIRARDVIIFVNRIDELGDPVREIPQIRDSIRETLQAQNGPADATILFGSAHWATNALSGDWDELGEASANALVAMAEHEARGGLEESNAVDAIWRLSGLPALGRAISERIIEGEGREMVEQAARAARNIANGLVASRAWQPSVSQGRGAQDRTREADGRDRLGDARPRPSFRASSTSSPTISRVGSTARAGPSCNGPRRRWSSTWRRTAKQGLDL